MNSALQRGRATIDQHLPRPVPRAPAATERDLLRRYIDVWERDDVDGLVSLLREDAVLRMPPQPAVRGAAAIAAFFRTTATNGDLRDISLAPTRANGRPAVIMHRRAADGTLRPHGILVLEVEGDRIAGLRRLGRARPRAALPGGLDAGDAARARGERRSAVTG